MGRVTGGHDARRTRLPKQNSQLKPNRVPMGTDPSGTTDVLSASAMTLYQWNLCLDDSVEGKEEMMEIK